MFVRTGETLTETVIVVAATVRVDTDSFATVAATAILILKALIPERDAFVA